MKTGLALNRKSTLINNLWLYYILGDDHFSDFLLFIKEYFKYDGVDNVSYMDCSVNSDFIIIFDSDESKTLFILKYL